MHSLFFICCKLFHSARVGRCCRINVTKAIISPATIGLPGFANPKVFIEIEEEEEEAFNEFNEIALREYEAGETKGETGAGS